MTRRKRHAEAAGFFPHVLYEGQVNGKFTSTAWSVAVGLKSATVETDQFMCQIKPDTQSVIARRGGLADLGKQLEDAVQLLRRNADAVVLYPDNRIASLCLQGHTDMPVRRREFGGIVQQVCQHLQQTGFVAFDSQVTLDMVEFQLLAVGMDVRAAELCRLMNQRWQRERLFS